MNSSYKAALTSILPRSTSPVSQWPVRTFLMWLVLACLMPGILGASGLFIYQYQLARTQQEKDTVRTARALVQAVDNHLLRARAVVQVLSVSDALVTRDFARFHQQARQAVSLSGLGTNIVLRNEGGQQLLNTAVEYGTPLHAQPAPQQVKEVFATGESVISPVFIGPVLKRPVMSVDVPVIIGGKVAYDLGVGILPAHFNSLLKEQGLPSGWIAAVFDKTGTIAGRTHSPDQFIGRKANTPLLQSMAKSREGSLETTTLDGLEVLSFYSRSPVTNWRVAIGIPRQAVQGTLLHTLSLLALGVATLFGISLVLARFMSQRIAHSVSALTAPAVALGNGGSAPIPKVHIKEAAKVAFAIGRAAKLLQERALELAEAHRLAKFGTWYWDLTTGAVRTSDSLREIYGREIPSFSDMRGTILPVESWEQIDAATQRTIRTGKGYDLEFQVNHGRGHTIWVHARGEAVRNEKGEVIALRGMTQDITERKHAEMQLRASEEKLRNAALHDPLTGLPNRALIMDYCERLLAAAQRGHAGGALLFIDLDRFKPINDLYGHETGDRVLQEVGRRLLACTRQEDLVGRLGGDEFVIVLPHMSGGVYHRAAVVARHVVASISEPIHINALEVSVSPSIGISYFPEHAANVSTLIHTADLAMYQAKQSGRASYQFYTPELDRRAEEALSVETRLRNALKHGGLTLYYQPVIDLKNGKLIGAEALLCLTDDGEVIGPDRFIPIAESAGLIGQLGEWVAVEACRQHAAWLRQGLRIVIAINVSPLQFRQRTFAETLGSIITESGMDPTCLEIEVTESAVMENIDEAVEILNRIKSLGVRVALDDFGTGYSSLSSLTSLPLDKLKVDQSFVRRIERDQASRTVTEAIIGLGRSLRLSVHGEGIESEDAMLFLEAHGCNQAQGYWFSRPLPPAEFVHWHHHQWGRDTNMDGWERVRQIWAPK
ncbi:bifunctional diguanylate cyclase/phosphodiesterase [Noviherbaspirillum autotrophicum]|uniref:bifunctional diguanylate cyclase/phosphodiesterase n=1 Tax=Noviherbaspirillum autotrophicum TaxID=709839 RepID=UPI000A5B2E53|nr:EAL domain-containing protein [Noviherbaspirillum autotrophicum]